MEFYKVNQRKIEEEYSKFSSYGTKIDDDQINDRLLQSGIDPLTRTHGDYDVFRKSTQKVIDTLSNSSALRVNSLTEAWVKLMGILKTKNAYIEGKKLYFRGQSNSKWAIRSSIVREIIESYGEEGLEFANTTQIDGITTYEKIMFNKFMKDIQESDYLRKVKNQGFVPPKDLNANWWAVMQHEGKFSTRLIDITESFLVALYFACAKWTNNEDEFNDLDEPGNPDSDGIVFIFEEDDINTIHFNKDESDIPFNRMKYPLKPNGEKDVNYFIRPEILHPRVVKQQGLFLTRKYLNEHIEIKDGYRLIIDKESKISILKELRMLGINRKKLVTDWGFNKDDQRKEYNKLMNQIDLSRQSLPSTRSIFEAYRDNKEISGQKESYETTGLLDIEPILRLLGEDKSLARYTYLDDEWYPVKRQVVANDLIPYLNDEQMKSIDLLLRLR